ncbi:alpha/beta hydrolase [Gilvimarinus sp. SDUM040013]|uniref:Alpha/beta hydrolase n=1 Tax=Gilvimarinus gilvus TaxID=3058038 RepID=A0ABU4RXE3_9GAMM|nr:alpha/beta hydrolase [Gilvimarinus sp. SDUM040013]MDO3388661.1 alpha/beta hydrolase [Gilvimarinus sp. SDUM040013]MDX6849556.1 alpha/beta hydrolase [Gilvimarinus sp. SDUM040013]
MQAVKTEQWTADTELTDFEVMPLKVGQEDLAHTATLIRASNNPKSTTHTILYVHGMTDYFFQEHLAHAFVEAGFAFYAIDLHGFGRSITANERPNYCDTVDEYFAEIDLAINTIKAETSGTLTINAHSTGGLILSLYAHRGLEREQIDGLCLNSPFFEFPADGIELLGIKLVAWLGRIFPHASYPRSKPSLYAQSIYKGYRGEWDYNLTIKPAQGFPLYLGWLNAIVAGQRELQAGLNIQCPVLVMHSAQSIRGLGRWRDDMLSTDAVLNVEHMRRFGPGLGQTVSLIEIEGGMHDLILSSPPVRAAVLAQMFAWLGQIAGPVNSRA